jgi:hypothetical protein
MKTIVCFFIVCLTNAPIVEGLLESVSKSSLGVSRKTEPLAGAGPATKTTQNFFDKDKNGSKLFIEEYEEQKSI